MRIDINLMPGRWWSHRYTPWKTSICFRCGSRVRKNHICQYKAYVKSTTSVFDRLWAMFRRSEA